MCKFENGLDFFVSLANAKTATVKTKKKLVQQNSFSFENTKSFVIFSEDKTIWTKTMKHHTFDDSFPAKEDPTNIFGMTYFHSEHFS